MRKLRFRLIATLLLSATFLGGCSAYTPIQIGVIGTMTGSNSDLSISGRRGVELAISEINEKGGVLNREITTVITDDANDSKTALDGIKSLEENNIRLIVGPFTSGMLTPNIDTIREMDVLLIGPSISADSLSGLDDNFIRFIATTKAQADVMVSDIIKQNYASFFVISDNRNAGFNDALTENFSSGIKRALGITVDSTEINPQNQTALNAVYNEIAEKKYDVVLMIASAEDVAKMCQTLYQELDKMPAIYSPLWSNTPELIRKGGVAVEGIRVVGTIDLDDTEQSFQTFLEKFETRYGETPTFASLYAYEATMELAEAIRAAGNLSPADVKKEMLSKGTYEGLQSTYKIDEYGDCTRKYQLFENVEGQMRKVN